MPGPLGPVLCIGFRVPNILWQTLKHFSRELSWAQTSYFWRVLSRLHADDCGNGGGMAAAAYLEKRDIVNKGFKSKAYPLKRFC